MRNTKKILWNERLWMDEDFWKSIKEIGELGKIKSVAWHIIGDNPGFPEGIERAYVRFEGQLGRILELPAPIEPLLYEHYKQWYLIKTALNKVHLQNQPLKSRHMSFAVDGTPNNGAVELTRQIAPYKGATCINQQRTHLYDHVIPEWVF